MSAETKTVFNILLFIEAVTIYRFTAADMSSNAIIPFSRLFAFALLFVQEPYQQGQ